MILVRVPILCNSVWIEQNDKYRFKGSEAKAIMIPRIGAKSISSYCYRHFRI